MPWSLRLHTNAYSLLKRGLWVHLWQLQLSVRLFLQLRTHETSQHSACDDTQFSQLCTALCRTLPRHQTILWAGTSIVAKLGGQGKATKSAHLFPDHEVPRGLNRKIVSRAKAATYKVLHKHASLCYDRLDQPHHLLLWAVLLHMVYYRDVAVAPVQSLWTSPWRS